MEQHAVKTYTASIYLGFENAHDNTTHTDTMAFDICREFCDKVRLCVTITPTKFIYVGGWEPGCIIGLINYPRFPSEPNLILRSKQQKARAFSHGMNASSYQQTRSNI